MESVPLAVIPVSSTSGGGGGGVASTLLMTALAGAAFWWTTSRGTGGGGSGGDGPAPPWAWFSPGAGGSDAAYSLPGEVLQFEEVSPRHMRAARAAAAEFGRRFQRSFEPSAVSVPAETVRALFASRAAVLNALYEVRLRLPNDLDLEHLLSSGIEDADRGMLGHIEDARQRCGAPLLHPGPLDAAWYGSWYRASNDSLS